MASVDKTFEALLDDPEERVEGTKVLDVGSSSFLADELRKLLLDCMRDRPWTAFTTNDRRAQPVAH